MSGEVSGVDLARVALRAAQEAARKNGGRTTKAKARATGVVRRDGREPMGLGAAIGALVTERAWELPAAGASLRDRWAAIAPDLAGHVAAVGYDADSGRLSLCPESAAWATKLRLEQARVIAAANTSAGKAVVRTLRILAPGAVPVTDPADVTQPTRTAPVGPEKTMETACEGYRQALAAHQNARPASRVDPAIAEAFERQNRALRELSAQAFPETQPPSADQPTTIDTARAQRRRESDATRALALRRARAEQAGLVSRETSQQPFGQTA